MKRFIMRMARNGFWLILSLALAACTTTSPMLTALPARRFPAALALAAAPGLLGRSVAGGRLRAIVTIAIQARFPGLHTRRPGLDLLGHFGLLGQQRLNQRHDGSGTRLINRQDFFAVQHT